MILATGSRVRLSNIRVTDLEPASAHKFTLSIVEPLTNLKRLRVIYDRNGFWTEDAGAAAIVAMEDKRLLGTLQFYRAGPGIHGYEIGYILHDENDRGKGYASEAVRLFSDYLFEVRPNCHRLQLIIEEWNDPSRAWPKPAATPARGPCARPATAPRTSPATASSTRGCGTRAPAAAPAPPPSAPGVRR